MMSLYKKEKAPIELMPAVIFNGEIERHLGAALCDTGFERIKENHWVRDLGIGVRKVVTIMHWKGAVSTPRWGYSLDYVPHFDNSYKNIYWHRTNKSAMIDVFPLYFDFFKYTLSRFNTPGTHDICLEASTPRMIQDMSSFYAQGCEIRNLVSILEKCESHKTSGLGFWNWSQLPLAYAFTLNKSGNIKKANEILGSIIRRTDMTPKAMEKLLERFQNVSA